MMRQRSAGPDGLTGEVGPLDVRLAVEVDADTGCPLAEGTLGGIRQSVTQSDTDERTCLVATENDETCGYRQTPVADACPCLVLRRHDCISDIESARDGQLRFSLVVPDRETLRSIIQDLREEETTVTVERIRTKGEGVQLDGSTLTKKQQEALTLAVESGYYDQPRGATLNDLAERLGISRSGVSQRLNAVERKLVRERAHEVACPGD